MLQKVGKTCRDGRNVTMHGFDPSRKVDQFGYFASMGLMGYAQTAEMALELGDHFAKEPNRETMLLAQDEIRKVLIDELDWGPWIIENANMVDRLLDIIDARRAEIGGDIMIEVPLMV